MPRGIGVFLKAESQIQQFAKDPPSQSYDDKTKEMIIQKKDR